MATRGAVVAALAGGAGAALPAALVPAGTAAAAGGRLPPLGAAQPTSRPTSSAMTATRIWLTRASPFANWWILLFSPDASGIRRRVGGFIDSWYEPQAHTNYIGFRQEHLA